ncbi:MAG: prolyl oligopeptidase family protein [Candidatus Bruticola sp.]
MFKCNFNYLLLALTLSSSLIYLNYAPAAAQPLSPSAPSSACIDSGSSQANNIKAVRTDFSETIHGVKVADPYRWMEDIDSLQTRRWVEAQQKHTETYLKNLPNRQAIRNCLDKLQNYPRFSLPINEAGKYFYYYNSGLQNQSVLYMSDSADQLGSPILDPNTFSQEGVAALTDAVPSPNGRYIAFSVAESGSDWNTIKVLDLHNGKITTDLVQWVKFSTIVWNGEGTGFFYSRYPEPAQDTNALAGENKYHSLYYHQVGQSQNQDRLIYSNPDNPDISVYGYGSEEHKWLCIEVSHSQNDNTAILAKDMSDPNSHFITLPNSFQAKFSIVDIQDGTLYAFTDMKAPNGRIVSIKLTKNIIDSPWQEVVSPTKEAISNVSSVGNRLFINYLHDAASRVFEYNLNGQLIREVKLPGIGTASSFSGKHKSTTAYYAYTSFNSPSVIYAYDLNSGKSSVWHKPQLSFEPNDFITKQVFVNSSDGAKVPLFITHRRDLKIDGNVPVLLYGYGGFAINMTPGFSARTMAWMQMGGVYAQASLRGGSEYGEAWHIAGTKTQKQHTFDDFINCAQWLIDHKYTNSRRLAINGGSNGGLLVGACLNQRPDLFGAAVPQVGVMDMLRFDKFTIGRYWTGDYGDVNKPKEFEALYRISPYHNIKPGESYPAVLITTGDHDDRVYPAHSFKYAAALQEAQAGKAPILIRIDSKAGHGAGKPISKRLDESADILAFIAKALNMDNIDIR